MKYQVWCPDNGDTEADSRTFEAYDAELAASEWAHWYDGWTADYTIVGGTDATVWVRDEKGAILRFTVSGRTERAYSSRLVRE